MNIFFYCDLVCWQSAQTVSNLQSSTTEFFTLMKSYALSITLTALNAALPALFYFLSRIEDYNPRAQVNIDLAR